MRLKLTASKYYQGIPREDQLFLSGLEINFFVREPAGD